MLPVSGEPPAEVDSESELPVLELYCTRVPYALRVCQTACLGSRTETTSIGNIWNARLQQREGKKANAESQERTTAGGTDCEGCAF